VRVSSVSDLHALRRTAGLDRVELQMDDLLRGNLPLYAVRYAMWSLRVGGTMHLHAPTTVASVSVVTGRTAWQLLVMQVCKGTDGWGEVTQHDLAARTLTCMRSREPTPPGPWSAAVMFSGSESEFPLLKRCVSALQAQPQIGDGGQILVCGPAAGEPVAMSVPGVEYMSIETPSRAGRFMIGAKKNLAMQALRHERILVCHTRMALRPGCLSAMPDEFDVITPRVFVAGKHHPLPYLDLGIFTADSTSLTSTRPATPCHYDRGTWLARVGRGYPYIDGGLFCLRKSLAANVPLSDSIGWGEAEDGEWALRLLHGGHLIELAVDAAADSLTCKIPRYARWGHLGAYQSLSNLAQQVRSLAAPFRR